MKYSKFFKLLEKKDHLIKKLSLLSDEQKEEAIEFFNKHPNYESEIDWNRKDLTWDYFEEVMHTERISGAQLKNFVKKDKHFLVLYSDKNCVLYQPLTWLGSRYLASTEVKPKVEGSWCISYQKDRSYWDDYSLKREKSFIILCTNTTKYALEISPKGTFVPWDAEDSKLNQSVFYNEISKEVPGIKSFLKRYRVVAAGNHSLVEQLHEKDLEECAYIEKVKEEERLHRIKIFPKSFKRQVRRKGYYEWNGDITYRDLKDLSLIDKEIKVDERFKYFKISGNLKFADSPITSITIPNSVASINTNAFMDCCYLSEIIIPDGVTEIGACAFYNCKVLKEINLPNSVKSIGKDAFDGCLKLSKVYIPDSVTSIGDFAFYECSSLTDITIPNSVTSIGNAAFSGCKSLTSINIPDSVTSIGDHAFTRCESLTEITIPNSVTKIGWSAFWGCSSLTSVTIPDSVTSIKPSAFEGCSSLTEIVIPDSITSIGNSLFLYCNSLKAVYIDKEKYSLDLRKVGIPPRTKVYWKGEF